MRRGLVRSAAFLAPLLAAAFASCSGALSRLSLSEANFLLRRGEHRQAVSHYSRAAADPEVEPYASYGLGLAFLAIGELEPALGRFRRAAEQAADGKGGGRELSYRSRYNAGIALYRSGNLAAAAEEFKRALIADGSKLAAKRNLELCLRGIERKRVPAASAAPLGTRPQGSEPKTLFDYIREKESDRWRSREWRADSANTPDY